MCRSEEMNLLLEILWSCVTRGLMNVIIVAKGYGNPRQDEMFEEESFWKIDFGIKNEGRELNSN